MLRKRMYPSVLQDEHLQHCLHVQLLREFSVSPKYEVLTSNTLTR